MKIGDIIATPRVRRAIIRKVFASRSEAFEEGYTEPTHYSDEQGNEVWGKLIELPTHYKLECAAVVPRKEVV